jgi:O-methyltransferase
MAKYLRILKYYISRLKLLLRPDSYNNIGSYRDDLFDFVYYSRLSKWESQNRISDFAKRSTTKFDFYRDVCFEEGVEKEIDFLEFGVSAGTSFKWWVENNKNTNSRFIGFDTFQGNPKAWGKYSKGFFTTNGREPDIRDSRVKFVKGLFQETLCQILPNLNLCHRTILHMDADLYSSTIYVLLNIAHKLKKGDLIIFDEFCSPLHEFRAFTDFIDATDFNYEVIGMMNNFEQVVIELGEVRR